MIYYKLIKRLLRKLIEKENQEIEEKKKIEQKRLIEEASLRCKARTESPRSRTFSEIIPEVEKIAIQYAENYIQNNEAILNQVQEEENEHLQPNQASMPPRGLYISSLSLLAASLSLSQQSKGSCSRQIVSFTRFQIEEMFKILVIPPQTLEEVFKQMDQDTLKKEFKKFALLVHPDKNVAKYAKIAFQKVFATYEKCKK